MLYMSSVLSYSLPCFLPVISCHGKRSAVAWWTRPAMWARHSGLRFRKLLSPNNVVVGSGGSGWTRSLVLKTLTLLEVLHRRAIQTGLSHSLSLSSRFVTVIFILCHQRQVSCFSLLPYSFILITRVFWSIWEFDEWLIGFRDLVWFALW